MDNEAIKQLIQAGIPDAEVIVEGEGCDLKATVISPAFEGKSLLEKQKMVLGQVKDQIRSGEIHALAPKAYTPEQWEARQNK